MSASLSMLYFFLVTSFAVGHALRSGPPRSAFASSKSELEMLPRSADELAQLCDMIGLARACNDPHLQSSKLTPKNDFLRTEEEPSACLPAGKVIFVHVMKTGGLSVDAFLRDACTENPVAQCSLRRHDGARGLQGNTNCHKPSICTSHESMLGALDVCGDEFRDAVYFTVLRDPVSRVWSFYNYISRWYKPYQTMTLIEVYDAIRAGKDLNEGLRNDEMCHHCEMQLKNAMSNHSFEQPDGALSQWKDQLRSLQLILDISSLDRFGELTAQAKLFPELRALSSPTEVAMLHENSVPSRWGEHPDWMTEQCIRDWNQQDVELYEFAKTLPNFMS
eukprot:CAMPEP_0170620762 /NCGR_PEP_ID=MMETSP0224-20130122/28231_1 /TAXON_ID=285029 /ORGANISM="Togula jolla, Strain CCCM 725" /LENGTH=333 /DNA_ID=CAMNT_0010946957 /DNA_START=39 /DNA_END=1040 /DNA_ORIENTATION=+